MPSHEAEGSEAGPCPKSCRSATMHGCRLHNRASPNLAALGTPPAALSSSTWRTAPRRRPSSRATCTCCCRVRGAATDGLAAAQETAAAFLAALERGRAALRDVSEPLERAADALDVRMIREHVIVAVEQRASPRAVVALNAVPRGRARRACNGSKLVLPRAPCDGRDLLRAKSRAQKHLAAARHPEVLHAGRAARTSSSGHQTLLANTIVNISICHGTERSHPHQLTFMVGSASRLLLPAKVTGT